jgi:hypothetical protein
VSWWPADLHRETVTVNVPTLGAPDDDGVPTQTTVPTSWAGVSVQPVGTSESLAAEKVVTSRWRASGPVAEWIPADATIQWRDTTYRVEGRPQTFLGGVLDHTELIFTEHTGR